MLVDEIEGPSFTTTSVKKKSIGVFGIGKDDEMASAWGRMGRVWIGGSNFRPTEGVGIKKPETILCDGVVISAETAVYDKLWSTG